MRVSIDGMSFCYSTGRRVLDGVDLSYESPETLCILGANGEGKSTLLQCLVGLLRPCDGSVLIDGKPVGSLSARELACKIAYLPQSHEPTFPFSVIDVVMMGRTAAIGPFSSPGASDGAFAEEQLGFLGISHLRDRPYTELSGGERQLVMLAAALAQEPQVLVLDEPTAHLDMGKAQALLRIVERLREADVGVIMTTHFPDQALFLGGKTALLRQGMIQCVGEASEVVTEESLRDLYGVRTRICEVEGSYACVPLRQQG